MDSNKSFYQMLIDIRDQQRHRSQSGMVVVRGRDLPWEITPHGKLKWYMHPGMGENVLQSHIIYSQEIPPGGRSGVQRHPGGMTIYFLQGHGHTVLDDEKIVWKAEDLLMLPLRPDGVVFQHVNDSSEDAVLLACEPNLVHALGVDRGSSWEQIEPTPEMGVPE